MARQVTQQPDTVAIFKWQVTDVQYGVFGTSAVKGNINALAEFTRRAAIEFLRITTTYQ